MAKPHKGRDTTASDLVRRDGALAMTFVNTVSRRRSWPSDYAELLIWGRQHGALSPAEAALLERCAAERPEEAAEAFRAAEALRALLLRIFNALADRDPPPPEMIEAFNRYLIHTVPPRRLVVGETGLRPGWAVGREEDLVRPLWRVVLSAFAILGSHDPGKVSRCAADGCGLLFVANNPGSRRKWCEMKTCGSRAKKRRHYQTKVKPYNEAIRRDVAEIQRKRALARRRRRQQLDG